MKRPRLNRNDLKLLGVLLPIAVLAAIFMALAQPNEEELDWRKRPSTFYAAKHGTKAAYTALDEAGYEVLRLRRPLREFAFERVSGLCILEPVEPLTDKDVDQLLAWVSRGNVLLIAPGRAMRDWFNVSEAMPPGAEPESADAGGEVIEVDPEADAGSEQKLASDSPLLRGIEELAVDSRLRFRPDDVTEGPLQYLPAAALWSDEHGVIMAEIERDRGRIIALVDAEPLTNEGLRRADNDLLLANLAWALGRGRRLASAPAGGIAFDEYHLGFAERDLSGVAIVKLVLDERWGWALGQAALVGGLALWAGAVRFGQPGDIRFRRRRRHREFAEAAGRLLHDAEADDFAYRTIFEHHRAEICRLLRLGTDAKQVTVTRALARRLDEDAARAYQRVAQGPATPGARRQDVMEMTQRLGRIIEVLKYGKQPRGHG